MSIADNISRIRTHIPANVKLVCVSKFHPNDDIMCAYNAGERIFGESRVQELLQKQASLPADIQWHFIGHLQTNKVKQIVPFVDLIHGVDSPRLLQAINNAAKNEGKTVNCLLQIHIAQEDTKFGFSQSELIELLESEQVAEFTNVRLCGIMGMATFTDNQAQVASEFQKIKSIFDTLKNRYFANDDSFCEISMGMSDDFQLAIEHGSTMVRVGSSIFGARV